MNDTDDPDTALTLIENIAFASGHLLTEAELSLLLHDLERNQNPMNGVVLSAIWEKYGEHRILRRFGGVEPSDITSYLLTRSSEDSTVARTVVLALLTESSDHNSASEKSDSQPLLSVVQVYALNELAVVAPGSQAFESLLMGAVVKHLAANWNASDVSSSFYTAYGWNAAVFEAAEQSPAIQDVLQVAAADIHDRIPKLLALAVQPERNATRQAALDLLDALDRNTTGDEAPLVQLQRMLNGDDSSESADTQTNDAALNLVLLEDSVRDGRLDEAHEYFLQLLNAELGNADEKSKLLQTVNSLGMALTRSGQTERAIETFSSVANLYPQSQVAIFAAEHVRHLESTRS